MFPLRWSFGIRSAILYGLLHFHCSQSSVRLPKPSVPPSTHLLYPTLSPCSCPHDPSTPPAVQTSHSHSNMHTTQSQFTPLPPTALPPTHSPARGMQDHVIHSVVTVLCLLYWPNNACSLNNSFISHLAPYGSLHANIKRLLYMHAVKGTVWHFFCSSRQSLGFSLHLPYVVWFELTNWHTSGQKKKE